MLYFAILGLLLIHQSVSQSCTSLTSRAACIQSEGCILDPTNELCMAEGWASGCCIDPITTTQAVTTVICATSTSCVDNQNAEACCTENTACLWAVNDSEGICGTPDRGSEICCTDAPTPSPTTPSPTTPEPTTPEPTTTVTCPPLSDAMSCVARSSEDCCDASTACTWNPNNLDICDSPDKGSTECCFDVTPTPTTPSPTTPEPTTPEPTTPEPTTPEPTTPEPTTPEPTTPEPTTPEPTTPEPTTPEPTTPEPTTPEPTTPEPTTPEPTTPEPTTPEPTTPEPTTKTTEYEEETTTESGVSWPTPRPTQPSAEKWEMIHPAYGGSDGELLWHIYYGDFSNDERFDTFRKGEKWNADEIRPIINSDQIFKRYVSPSQKFKSENSVVADSTTRSYGTWLIGASLVLIIMFAIWYKYTSNKKNSEYTPLLQEDKVNYAY